MLDGAVVIPLQSLFWTLLFEVAALLWMVHPIHTNVVDYTWQRATSLSTTFSLLAMLSFLWSAEARRGPDEAPSPVRSA